jgi:zinc transport system ATP-binding protein
MLKTVIEIRDLWFSFNGQPVLSDVHLDIHEKDFLAIIGPNGGGKTTLLKLILGLLKPHQGTLRVFGKPATKMAHRMGYVPQYTGLNTSFPISVFDVVMMGRRRPGLFWTRRDSQNKRIVVDALTKMGMWAHRHRRMAELSGGQRQRVFIARALATEPDILILDEPTASIDTQGQTEFYALLKEINTNITIVLVSHDLMVISSHVEAVACVNRTLHYHNEAEVTEEMIDMCQCPVELVAHGLPHRVLKPH